MAGENRLFEDMARMANGAMGALSGFRGELETMMRQRLDRWLAEMNLVQREEFDVVRSMAQRARSEQEDLLIRIAALEERLRRLEGGPSAAELPAAAPAESGESPAEPAE